VENLTDKQIKTRWADIKKVLKERQLLVYLVEIPIEKWDLYMHSTPSESEVNRIYNVIQSDRIAKTLRIKNELSKIVGYREAKEFSKRAGVSDTIIRDILEGKKEKVGYDVINRLEIFLNAILPDFEPSIENTFNRKIHTVDTIIEITANINKAANRIKDNCLDMIEQTKSGEMPKDIFGKPLEPTYSLRANIEWLNELRNQIDLLWDTYLKNKQRL
jgi:transcriptional regulator with XRE-family HTH domain